MREAQVLQGAVNGIVRHREAELLVQPHHQIARPPAHHAVNRCDGALLHEPGQKRPVLLAQLGWHARGRDVDETVRSLLVEPDHPVPQRLTVHPTDLGGIFPQSAVEHCRDRQQPPRLRGILRPLGKPADLVGTKVRPHRNRLAHGKRPSVCHLKSCRSRFVNPRESQALRGLVEVLRPVWRRAFHVRKRDRGVAEPASAIKKVERGNVSCQRSWCFRTPDVGQLGEVRRHAAGLVAGQQLGR